MKQFICYGDSNTWGLIPGTPNRYPWGIRWTSILQKQLEQQDVRIIEEGLCGRTTMFEDSYRENRNGCKTLQLILESHAPVDGVILMLGTNDCKTYYGLDAHQVTQGIEQCVDRLMEAIPPENILLISPIFLGESVWKAEFDPEFNQKSVETSRQLPGEYKKLAAEKKIHFIAASDYAGPSEIDQEHMTEAGHAALARAVAGKLTDSAMI